ncbi:MAG TPA: cell envelope integrity protein TolA [Casimicrobiaceae bacterium]
MARSERPRAPRKITGKWLALALALLVEAAFVAVLVFSVTWQNRKPEPVTAELYAPPTKAPPSDTPPVAKPPPVPAPEPAPKPEPSPKPQPLPKPEPKASVPDPHDAEIALKAKAEDERRQKDTAQRLEAQKKAEADRRDAQKARERKEAEDRRLLEEKKSQDDKRAAEARVRQQKETDALLAQADSETRAHAQKAAEDAARGRAQADWIRSIQAKVRGNVNVPPDIAGNPEAIFEVVQLPTGEIIDVQLRKGSGNRVYDDAVQRAILKSSPLPRPDRPELFQRSLTLKFRPLD